MNPMDNCTVESIEIISPTSVLFSIRLSTHVHLQDTDVIAEAMNAYMAKYPRVRAWHAYTRGDFLFIQVSGKLDKQAAQFGY